jgi:hypothetical protein
MEAATVAESTLSLAYADYSAEVGLFLGYGRGATKGDTAWDTRQTAAIESCVRSGVRQFYFPPPVPGFCDTSYDWSFLRPTATLTLTSGDATIALPDDFGGFEDRGTLTTTGAMPVPLELVGEGRIRQMYAEQPSATGQPLLMALRPIKGTATSAGQRFELYLFPTPEKDYSLSYEYYVLPDVLDGTSPYAYGGGSHSETILESCLAIAEQRLDDSSTVHTMKFMERLAASIALDRRMKPEKLGYNGDRSDGLDVRRGRLHGLARVTYNGVSY